MKTIKTYVLLICFLLPVWLVAQVTFEASADVSKILQSDYVEVSFVISNGEPSSFKPPDFKNFQVVSKHDSKSFKLVNRRFASSIVKVYVLQGNRAGKHRIGSAVAVVRGKTYKTKPLTIEVLRPAKKGPREKALERLEKGTALFLRAEVEDTKIFPGQEVVLDFNLYTSVDLGRLNLAVEPVYNGFEAIEIKRYDDSWKTKTIKGVEYKVKSVRRIALFPRRSDSLDVSPMQIRARINIKGFRRALFEDISSKPVEFERIDLPEDPPESFSGAVGKYEVQLVAGNKNVIATNEPYSMRMSIFGSGDIATIQAPDLGLSPNDFKVYDPKPSQQIKENDGHIYNIKVFEYVILPQRSGRFTIAPEFTYFDPDSMAYVRLQTGRVQLQVTATDAAGNIAPGEDAIDEAYRLKNQDILSIKPSATFRTQGDSFFGSAGFWGLLALPVLLFGGVIGYRQVQIKRGNIDPMLLKRQRAGKVAQQRLSVAKSHLDAGKSRTFYDEISQALWGYVGDKLDIPLSELSKENVREQLAAKGISEAHSERFLALLNTCEMALFAGMDNAGDMGRTYEEAAGVIIGIEADEDGGE